LCSVLLDEYEIEGEQCRHEVGQLLEEMVRLGLVIEQKE
ncbi:MAG: PqqD family protein, partial [Bacteroidales bacterium]|nr:PqqD family protein [Bacteroidales bacterium]